MQLNKFVAQAGVASRRKAQELIEAGEIKVNGKVQTNSAYRVQPEDTVTYKNKVLYPEKKVYILLNKPKGYITTTSDEKDRKTVLDILENVGKERLYPVGRLDRDTTGVLLITNDGTLAQILAHPSYEVSKAYNATLDKPIDQADFIKIKEGIKLEDGFIKPDQISVAEPGNYKKIKIKIHSGKNRIVKRIFEALGYQVKKLDRVSYAKLNKKTLGLGQFRVLTKSEIKYLYQLAKKDN